MRDDKVIFSSLLDGTTLHKDDICFEALGILDELNAHLGVIRAQNSNYQQKAYLKDIQQVLMQISAYIADSYGETFMISPDDVSRLDAEIDALLSQYPTLTKLVIPGDNLYAAQIDIARTVARRAERIMVAAHKKKPMTMDVLHFINKLSGYLFSLARLAEYLRQGVS